MLTLMGNTHKLREQGTHSPFLGGHIHSPGHCRSGSTTPSCTLYLFYTPLHHLKSTIERSYLVWRRATLKVKVMRMMGENGWGWKMHLSLLGTILWIPGPQKALKVLFGNEFPGTHIFNTSLSYLGLMSDCIQPKGILQLHGIICI
jgi:hypothetical protein